MNGETSRSAYLLIQDLLGVRHIPLVHTRYLVGGSADCDIQLISATAHECQTLFIRSGDRYRVSQVDLHTINGQQVSDCEYELQDGDRIIYAPGAVAVYYMAPEPPTSVGVGARLPVPPSLFPPAEAPEPLPHALPLPQTDRCHH